MIAVRHVYSAVAVVAAVNHSKLMVPILHCSNQISAPDPWENALTWRIGFPLNSLISVNNYIAQFQFTQWSSMSKYSPIKVRRF